MRLPDKMDGFLIQIEILPHREQHAIGIGNNLKILAQILVSLNELGQDRQGDADQQRILQYPGAGLALVLIRKNVFPE